MSPRTAFPIVLAVAALSACAPAREPPTSGTPAPDFELRTLDGGRERLSSYHGDVVLIDFWATFCKPCLDEMPRLDALFRRHERQGFVVLGVSIDDADSLDDVRATVAKTGVSFPILLDTRTLVIGRYTSQPSAPYGVLVGRDGSIADRRAGYAETGEIERSIESALKQ